MGMSVLQGPSAIISRKENVNSLEVRHIIVRCVDQGVIMELVDNMHTARDPGQ